MRNGKSTAGHQRYLGSVWI
ncbi:hypothetical protein [Escherichia coli]